MKDIIKEYKDKIIEILTKYTAEEDFMNKKDFAEFCINNTVPIIQKVISQTQKEAYEKGRKEALAEHISLDINKLDGIEELVKKTRLETIKEIEDKLDNMIIEVVGNSAKTLEQVKSILNQLKVVLKD